MANMRTWLVGLLAAQLALAMGLYVYNQNQTAQRSQLLFNFTQAQVDKIVINDDVQEVTLTKEGEIWRLPELQALPANQQKLTALLQTVSDLKGNWPVAKTQSSYERFEVAENKYQRRITLYQGDAPLGVLFIGTSSGLRQAHVRAGSGQHVYALALDTDTVETQAKAWLDRSLLASKNVTSIKGPDYRLQRQDDAWVLVDQTAVVDDARAQQLVMRLENLTIKDPAIDVTAKDAQGVTLKVSAEGGDKLYTFFQNQEQYYVERDDVDQVFSLSQADYESIAQINAQELIQPPQKTEDTHSTGS